MGVSEFKTMSRGGATFASITVSGDGEIMTIPDIATVNFTIRESAKTVSEAEKLAENKMSKSLSSLYSLGVDKKDIKTESYNVNPKYENAVINYTLIPQPPTNPKLVGYEVEERISVKIRKIDITGDVLSYLGSNNISEMYGPDFTVDGIDKIRIEAKEKAIKDAREKAEKTAKALGVSLGSIVQFSEDNNGVYYAAPFSKSSDTVGATAVSISVGQNSVKSHVSITYSIN